VLDWLIPPADAATRGGTGKIFYIHDDQLGAPLDMTRTYLKIPDWGSVM